MNQVDDSKFNMWRACMGILHVDGAVSKDEERWAEEKIADLPFDDNQRRVLRRDLADGLDIETVLPSITHAPDRAFLLHMIRTVGHLDGYFDENEKAVFKKLEGKILEKLDLDAMEEKIKDMEERSYALKKDEILNKNSVFENIIANFKWWLGIS